MKKIIFSILLISFAAMSCEENEVTYAVSPELSGYVDAFYSEAEARNVTLPKNLIADLSTTVQAYTKEGTDKGQNTLYYNSLIFQGQKDAGLEAEIEKTTFMAMGRLFMKKNVEWESRDQYLNAVFD
jgi:hypothetical protein